MIGPGDDDGENQTDERIRVGASIDSITAGVKIRIGSAGPILPKLGRVVGDSASVSLHVSSHLNFVCCCAHVRCMCVWCCAPLCFPAAPVAIEQLTELGGLESTGPPARVFTGCPHSDRARPLASDWTGGARCATSATGSASWTTGTSNTAQASS